MMTDEAIEALRPHIKEMGQVAVAEKAGISQSAISSYLSKRYKPNADTIAKIAHAVGYRTRMVFTSRSRSQAPKQIAIKAKVTN